MKSAHSHVVRGVQGKQHGDTAPVQKAHQSTSSPDASVAGAAGASVNIASRHSLEQFELLSSKNQVHFT